MCNFDKYEELFAAHASHSSSFLEERILEASAKTDQDARKTFGNDLEIRLCLSLD